MYSMEPFGNCTDGITSLRYFSLEDSRKTDVLGLRQVLNNYFVQKCSTMLNIVKVAPLEVHGQNSIASLYGNFIPLFSVLQIRV